MKPFMFSLPSSYTQYSSCTDAFVLWCFLFMLHYRFPDKRSNPTVAVAFQSQRHSESSLIRGQYDLIHLFIPSVKFYGVSWRHVPSNPYSDSLEAFRFMFRLSCFGYFHRHNFIQLNLMSLQFYVFRIIIS